MTINRRLMSLSILISSFLLFLIQPISSKALTPSFGGTPSVWNSCLMFFQLFLLFGYASSCWFAKYEKARSLLPTYWTLLLCSLLLFPVSPDVNTVEIGNVLPIQVLLILSISLGLPYLILASTSPLIQHWHSRLFPGQSPYRLYALSNIGSLMSLICYPILIEPVIPLSQQFALWKWFFRFDVSVLGLLSLYVFLKVRNEKNESEQLSNSNFLPVSLSDKILWFIYPAVSTALLIAITNVICNDITNVPFLWILPLSFYLISFIITFDRPHWYRRKPFIFLAIIGILALTNLHLLNLHTGIFRLALVAVIALFSCCMVAHGELYKLKPSERSLTEFYLFLSAGGACGGIFVSMVSPLIFEDYHELNISTAFLILALLYSLRRFYLSKGLSPWKQLDWNGPVAVSIMIFIALFLPRHHVGALDFMTRNFFGILKVRTLENEKTTAKVRTLTHGNTLHGQQSLKPEDEMYASTYYATRSGLGISFSISSQQHGKRVALLGMGIGTLATYGRSGDHFRFFEIDPDIITIAEKYFTYLRKSKAKIDIVLGDARHSLQKDTSGKFDILVLDVFSSDAIPTHLLTKEAFALYLKHLKPDGWIGINISNRYLDLLPVCQALAQEFGLNLRHVVYNPSKDNYLETSSDHVILSRDTEFLNNPNLVAASTPLPVVPVGNRFLWTDDYSSVLWVLR